MSARIPAALSLRRGNLLLVVTGAYAASHVPMWVETIREWYADVTVRVVVTQAALKFVTPTRLAITTGSPMWGPEWPAAERSLVPHRELAEWADCLVVLPASTNSVAKIAAGIADDFAHSVIQTAPCPVVVVPAVPPEAYKLRVFPANVERLRSYGFVVLDPVEGKSASNRTVEYGGPAPIADVMMAIAVSVVGVSRESKETENVP